MLTLGLNEDCALRRFYGLNVRKELIMKKKTYIAVIVSSLLFVSLASASTKTDRAVWGAQTRFALNRAFNNEVNADICMGKPDYYCNGLMVSAFEMGDDDYWMHLGLDKKLSFTYFRTDIATSFYGPVGYILFPQNKLDVAMSKGWTQNSFPAQYRCAFPVDALTTSRDDNGCGKLNILPEDSGPCQLQGITTAAQWLDKFGYKTSDAKTLANIASCGFTLEGYSEQDKKQYFSVNTEIQHILLAKNPDAKNAWNEIVAAAWPTDNPPDVPVIAFFYVQGGSQGALVQNENHKNIKKYSEEEALALAQKQQLTYYTTTNIFIPIVKISGPRSSAVFTYADDEQSKDILDGGKSVNVYPD